MGTGHRWHRFPSRVRGSATIVSPQIGAKTFARGPVPLSLLNRFEFEPHMHRKRRVVGIDPAGGTCGAMQIPLPQQGLEDGRDERAIDMRAETRMKPVTPKNVIVRRPINSKSIGIIDF